MMSFLLTVAAFVVALVFMVLGRMTANAIKWRVFGIPPKLLDEPLIEQVAKECAGMFVGFIEEQDQQPLEDPERENASLTAYSLTKYAMNEYVARRINRW